MILGLQGKIRQINKQIQRMSKVEEKRWTREFKKILDSEPDSFAIRFNNQGIPQFSSAGLNDIQRDILEVMVDERLKKGVFSLKKENERKRNFIKRASEKGYVEIKESENNVSLIFFDYYDERDFFDFLNDVMDLVDFFYDPEGSRDYIHDAYRKNKSPEEVAKDLKNGLHEPIRVKPPTGKGGENRGW